MANGIKNGHLTIGDARPELIWPIKERGDSFASSDIFPFESPVSNAALDKKFFDEELPFEIRPGYDVFDSDSANKTPGYFHDSIKIISRSIEPEIFRGKSKPITEQEIYGAVRTVCSGLMGHKFNKVEFEVNKDYRRKHDFIEEAYVAIKDTLDKAMSYGNDCIITGMNYNATEGLLIVEFIANGGAIGSYYKHSI